MTDSLAETKFAGRSLQLEADRSAAMAELLNLPGLSEEHKNAASGDPQAMLKLGLALQSHKSWDAAALWIARAAKQGLPAAMHQIGLCLQYGWGCQRSEFAARRWYRQAAQREDPDGMFFYSKCVFLGKGKGWIEEEAPDKRDESAKQWLKRAAAAGNPFAQNELGYWYWIGRVVQKKPQRAVRWWLKAAENGDADAAFNLGYAFERGENGVPPDPLVAVQWYERADELGCDNAWARLTRPRMQKFALRLREREQHEKRVAEEKQKQTEQEARDKAAAAEAADSKAAGGAGEGAGDAKSGGGAASSAAVETKRSHRFKWPSDIVFPDQLLASILSLLSHQERLTKMAFVSSRWHRVSRHALSNVHLSVVQYKIARRFWDIFPSKLLRSLRVNCGDIGQWAYPKQPFAFYQANPKIELPMLRTLEFLGFPPAWDEMQRALEQWPSITHLVCDVEPTDACALVWLLVTSRPGGTVNGFAAGAVCPRCEEAAVPLFRCSTCDDFGCHSCLLGTKKRKHFACPGFHNQAQYNRMHGGRIFCHSAEELKNCKGCYDLKTLLCPQCDVNCYISQVCSCCGNRTCRSHRLGPIRGDSFVGCCHSRIDGGLCMRCACKECRAWNRHGQPASQDPACADFHSKSIKDTADAPDPELFLLLRKEERESIIRASEAYETLWRGVDDDDDDKVVYARDSKGGLS